MTKTAREIDLSVAYIVRALTIGLLTWCGYTLVNLDRTVAVIEVRLTSLEHRIP